MKPADYRYLNEIYLSILVGIKDIQVKEIPQLQTYVNNFIVEQEKIGHTQFEFSDLQEYIYQQAFNFKEPDLTKIFSKDPKPNYVDVRAINNEIRRVIKDRLESNETLKKDFKVFPSEGKKPRDLFKRRPLPSIHDTITKKRPSETVIIIDKDEDEYTKYKKELMTSSDEDLRYMLQKKLDYSKTLQKRAFNENKNNVTPKDFSSPNLSSENSRHTLQEEIDVVQDLINKTGLAEYEVAKLCFGKARSTFSDQKTCKVKEPYSPKFKGKLLDFFTRHFQEKFGNIPPACQDLLDKLKRWKDIRWIYKLSNQQQTIDYTQYTREELIAENLKLFQQSQSRKKQKRAAVTNITVNVNIHTYQQPVTPISNLSNSRPNPAQFFTPHINTSSIPAASLSSFMLMNAAPRQQTLFQPYPTPANSFPQTSDGPQQDSSKMKISHLLN